MRSLIRLSCLICRKFHVGEICLDGCRVSDFISLHTISHECKLDFHSFPFAKNKHKKEAIEKIDLGKRAFDCFWPMAKDSERGRKTIMPAWKLHVMTHKFNSLPVDPSRLINVAVISPARVYFCLEGCKMNLFAWAMNHMNFPWELF